MMKTAIVLILLLPLVLASPTLPAAPDSGYHVVVKFQSSGTLPGETIDSGFGIVPQSVPERSLDQAVAISSSGLGDLGSCKNTYRLFYNLVPVRKLNAVFVI